MRKHLNHLLLLMSAALAPASSATAGVRHIWALHDGDKVERDAREHPARARNTVWDGRVVRIFGAQNEVIAFQVIVEADPYETVRLSLARAIEDRTGGSRIPAEPAERRKER